MNESEELSETRIKQLAKMPIVETKLNTSKDGKYIIHKTVITDIKPKEYYSKVLQNSRPSAE